MIFTIKHWSYTFYSGFYPSYVTLWRQKSSTQEEQKKRSTKIFPWGWMKSFEGAGKYTAKKYEWEETILRSYCIVRMLRYAAFGWFWTSKFFSENEKKLTIRCSFGACWAWIEPYFNFWGFFSARKFIIFAERTELDFQKKFWQNLLSKTLLIVYPTRHLIYQIAYSFIIHNISPSYRSYTLI